MRCCWHSRVTSCDATPPPFASETTCLCRDHRQSGHNVVVCHRYDEGMRATVMRCTCASIPRRSNPNPHRGMSVLDAYHCRTTITPGLGISPILYVFHTRKCDVIHASIPLPTMVVVTVRLIPTTLWVRVVWFFCPLAKRGDHIYLV